MAEGDLRPVGDFLEQHFDLGVRVGRLEVGRSPRLDDAPARLEGPESRSGRVAVGTSRGWSQSEQAQVTVPEMVTLPGSCQPEKS